MKRTIAIALLLVLLTACGTSPVATVDAPPLPEDDSPRILTPLTPGLHDPYVLLEDGYLHFAESTVHTIADWDVDGERGTLTYAEAIEALGFDLAEVFADFPEHLQLDKTALVTDVTRVSEYFDDEPGRSFSGEYQRGVYGKIFGGYEFCKRGEPYGERGALKPKLVLMYQSDRALLTHDGCGDFVVLPRVRRRLTGREALMREYGYGTEYPVSVVKGIEVGVTHFTSKTGVSPEVPYETYYAGFYVGETAFSLESHGNYCTQEEFISLLLALVDAATENLSFAPAEIPAPSPMLLNDIHDPYIEQPNGYAVFNEGDPETAMAALSADGEYQTLTRQLGFDPADVIVTLPSRLLAPHREGTSMRWDGPDYELRKQDPDNRYKTSVAETQPRYLELVLTTDPVPSPDGSAPGQVSYIEGTEVTLLHADPYAAIWPEQPLARWSYLPQYSPEPQHRYFAAFARNGVTVALYCQNGYLSQSDFLDMVTALVCAGR